MNYEELLNKAYKNVQKTEQCERFELLKVTGHHEGTKTIITNFEKVVSCLRREAEHIKKYLTKELASPLEQKGERLIITRKIPSALINEKIEKYAKTFVLCKNCNKPDTELQQEKNHTTVHCLACGTKTKVHNL